MARIRIYELAQRLRIDEAATLQLANQHGAHARNRLSAIEGDIARRVERALAKARAAQTAKATPSPLPVEPSGKPVAVAVSLDAEARAELRRIGDLLERLVKLAEEARASS